jgi:iron(III) transport system permease protein
MQADSARGGLAAPPVSSATTTSLRDLTIRFLPGLFAIVLFLVVASPIIPIVYQAFIDRPIYDSGAVFTLRNFSNLFSNEQFREAAINTVWFVLLSTVMSTVVGLAFGLAVDRLRLPMRRTLKIAFLSPLFVSPLILAFAWSMLYGPGGYATLLMKTTFGMSLPNLNSIIGMSIVAGVAQAPISYLYCAGAIANIPASLERSARSSGAGPFRTIRDIVLPLLRPSIMFCAMLNMILVLDLLAVPLIIGDPARIQVIASFLYSNGVLAAQVDYGIVAATAIFLLIAIQFFVVIQAKLVGDSRRYATVGGRIANADRADIGSKAWIIWGVLMLYAFTTSVLPCLFLVLRSFTSFLSPLIPISKVITLANYELIFSYDAYVRSIVNTVVVSIGGGLFAVVLTCAAAIVAYRTRPRMRHVIEQISFIPRSIPGLVVGIGVFYMVIFLPFGGEIRHTLIILVIAFTIRYFSTGFAAIGPAFFQIGADLERAVRSSGGTWWRALRDVTLPLLRKAIIACFLIYFIHFFKEYAAASFLFGPGTEVIGTTMLQLNLMGNLGSVAALSVIQIVLTVPVAIFIYARD